MTLEQFNAINWHRGNAVRLLNGKEYPVKGVKGHGRYLLLYSEEFDSSFVADHRIVDCRTSDYEEPEEVYLEKVRQKMEAALFPKVESPKEEKTELPPVDEAPKKRVRQRIRVAVHKIEKVSSGK